jgi:hypothetical protein
LISPQLKILLRFYQTTEVQMMKMLTIIALSIGLSIAGAPDTLWTRTYGRPDYDEGFSVQQTSDGGFIATGFTEGLGGGLRNVYLVKTDSDGDTMWTKGYGGPGIHFGHSVEQTTDGGYIIAGGSSDYSQIADVYLVKTDSLGDTLWTKLYGGVEYDEANSVQQTSDGGYIVVGFTQSFGATIADVYLLKTDANGDTLWTKMYGWPLWEEGRSVQETEDGYIITGYRTVTSSPNGPDSYVLLIKTDFNGDTMWTRLYEALDEEYRDEGYSVDQTSDGGYIISGETWYPGTPAWEIDVYLIKTDADGDTQWTRTYDALASTDIGFSVQQTQDGGFIVAGYSNNVTYNHDVYLIKTEADGDTVWTKRIGGPTTDEGYSVQQTSDCGYIVAGWTLSYGVGGHDLYLVRTEPEYECGNANGDDDVTTGDGFYILNYCGSLPRPVCCWSANVNGSSGISAADGFHLLNYLGTGPELDCEACEF